MALTEDEEEKLRFMLSTLEDAQKALTEWERKFLADQIKRYDEYGPMLVLSGKQWSVLNSMFEKVSE